VEAFRFEMFDVVLMDIQMPRLNGAEATQQIPPGSVRRAGAPPIIALSANVMAHQVEAYRRAGMDEVVEKPIDPVRLYAVLEAVAERRA
jgi:CheY-like chemotaxis protein